MSVEAIGHDADFQRDGAQEELIEVAGYTLHQRDIATYACARVEERDWDGQWLCFSLYLFIASLFVYGLIVGVLDIKFGIAVAFFGALALMSLVDAVSTRPIGYYVVDIVTRDGGHVAYTSVEMHTVAALTRWLDGAVRTSEPA